MKKTLVALAGIGVLAHGCYSPRHFLKEMYAVSPTEHLIANNQKGLVTYIKESEEDGLRDLQRLVKEVPLEEAWVYIPEDKEWWEVGRYSWEEASSSLASLNSTLVEILAGTSKEATKYHIHPEKALRSLYLKSLSRIGNLSDVMPWDSFVAYASLPSSNDLYAALTFSCDIREQFPQRTLRFKVASPLGVTEYTPRAEAVGKICAEEGQNRYFLLRKAIVLTYNLTDIKSKIGDVTELHPTSSAVLYSDDNFEITFKAYPK